MEKEIKFGGFTLSQVEAAWDTIFNALDALDECIKNDNNEAHALLLVMGLRNMIFGPKINATMRIAAARLEAGTEKKGVAVGPEGINFSLMPSGDKS